MTKVGKFFHDHIIGMIVFTIVTGIMGNYVYDYLKQQSSSQRYEVPPIANTFEDKRKKLISSKVNYFVSRATDGLFSKRLKAEIDGRTYVIIDEKDDLCLDVVDQRDYDGNGSDDALIIHITACGGNGSGNEFIFVSYLGGGHFQKSESFGYSWGDPKIEKWKGRWSVLVTSHNEGFNTDAPEERIERFVLDSGRAVKVEESERRAIISVVELRSGQFDFNKHDEVKNLSFDLDGDRIDDKIEARLWHRWGRIIWTVKFSSGALYSSDVGCKRIGILLTKSNSINDLVCDQDTVLRWTGAAYASN
jgi:hypothetical protein